MRTIHIISFFLILLISCNNRNNSIYIVTDFDAVGDSITLNTNAIQACIDKANKNGGGTVIIPQGRFLTGTLFLKSNVSFQIQNGGELLGSADLKDYPIIKDSTSAPHETNVKRHLIAVLDAQNVTIEGNGTINGRGWNFWEKPENPYQWVMAKDRPDAMILVKHSKNVRIRDLNLINPANWTGNIHTSEKVSIRGIVINNNLRSPNSDGFDISGSREVIISDCNISTCDDAIVLNAVPGEVKNISITNCIIRTLCAAVKIGWPEKGSFNISDVNVSNCNIWASNRGVAIYQGSGAITENITVNNIVFESNAPIVFIRPIHIDLRKGKNSRPIGIIRNVIINNFVATTQGRILVTAEKGGFIENLSLTNIKMQYPYFENPEVYAKNPTSSQASNMNPEARIAKAAIVAENVRNLFVNDIQINWPGKTVPNNWMIDNKIENGSANIHHPDYSKTRPVEFSVFWGRGLEKATVNIPLCKASDTTMPDLDIKNSTSVIYK